MNTNPTADTSAVVPCIPPPFLRNNLRLVFALHEHAVRMRSEGRFPGERGGRRAPERRRRRKTEQSFLVDLALRYPSLAASGADFQLTGPAPHQNQASFPGAFSPDVDEKVPGLIVLLSTTTNGAENAQNLANLFNLTGFTNQRTNEVWDTWIVGAPSFGKNVRSVLRVAVDKNKDGIYNDAPAVVPDSNHDGRISAVDLRAYGVRAVGTRALASKQSALSSKS
jgi:hypothetical protein